MRTKTSQSVEDFKTRQFESYINAKRAACSYSNEQELLVVVEEMFKDELEARSLILDELKRRRDELGVMAGKHAKPKAAYRACWSVLANGVTSGGPATWGTVVEVLRLGNKTPRPSDMTKTVLCASSTAREPTPSGRGRVSRQRKRPSTTTT